MGKDEELYDFAYWYAYVGYALCCNPAAASLATHDGGPWAVLAFAWPFVERHMLTVPALHMSFVTSV